MLFRNWLEYRDIFAHDKVLAKMGKYKSPSQEINLPISPQTVVRILEKHKVGDLKVHEIFPDYLVWGTKDDAGSMLLDLSPLGSWKAFIRKATPGLKGEMVWILKRAIPLTDFEKDTDNLTEKRIAEICYHELISSAKEPLDHIEQEYNLVDLVRKINWGVQKEHPKWFIYEGVKRMDENRYLIYFSLIGQGVEAPQSARVEQFNIDINFNPKSGLIRIFAYEIQSPTRVHRWEPMPSEWDEKFMPTQSIKEITHCVLHMLHTY